MAEQQEHQDNYGDVEESLRNEKKMRHKCEQRLAEMEKKIQRLNEKNKEKEMKEEENGRNAEKQKVCDCLFLLLKVSQTLREGLISLLRALVAKWLNNSRSRVRFSVGAS